VREAADAVKADAAAARAAAERGNERVEAIAAEVAFAISNLDELKQGLSSAGQAAVIARREAEQARKAAQIVGDGSTERVTEVFQQILGLAAARNAGNRRPAPQPVKKPDPVKREPRHGFDDVTTPMAILTVDGKFKELNPAFARLVGYQEHEFTKAAWPSPHDRRDYKDQLEQLRRLGAGELSAVEVSSTYMHGQGLMVPVVGKLSVELGEDGLPLQLVLEAEDRHTG
jgi:PAS domain S-box-containing protein